MRPITAGSRVDMRRRLQTSPPSHPHWTGLDPHKTKPGVTTLQALKFTGV